MPAQRGNVQSIWIGVGRSIQRRPKFGGQPSVELALGDTLGPDLIDYPGRRLQLLDLLAEVSFECFNGGREVADSPDESSWRI